MKEWLLGRGQTLIALVITIGATWGVITMYLKLPKDPGNENISTLAVVLIGLVVTLAGTATALGTSLIEPKKEEPK